MHSRGKPASPVPGPFSNSGKRLLNAERGAINVPLSANAFRPLHPFLQTGKCSGRNETVAARRVGKRSVMADERARWADAANADVERLFRMAVGEENDVYLAFGIGRGVRLPQ